MKMLVTMREDGNVTFIGICTGYTVLIWNWQ